MRGKVLWTEFSFLDALEEKTKNKFIIKTDPKFCCTNVHAEGTVDEFLRSFVKTH
jgi:hypothetical protein